MERCSWEFVMVVGGYPEGGDLEGGFRAEFHYKNNNIAKGRGKSIFMVGRSDSLMEKEGFLGRDQISQKPDSSRI